MNPAVSVKTTAVLKCICQNLRGLSLICSECTTLVDFACGRLRSSAREGENHRAAVPAPSLPPLVNPSSPFLVGCPRNEDFAF